MEFPRIQNAIDLLGQAPPRGLRGEAVATEPANGPSPVVQPKLEIAWGSFHGGAWSHLAALLGPSASQAWREANPFRDSCVEGRVPKRAVLAAGLWHVAILALPISLFTAMPRRN